MNRKNILQNLGSLDELSLLYESETYPKISMLQIDTFNYGIFLYSPGSCRISFIKLNLKELICNLKDDFVFTSSSNEWETKPIGIYLLNVFCLPFPVSTVVSIKKNFWAVGQDTVVNLKPYIEKILADIKTYENEDAMDVDEFEEYQPNMFDIEVKVSKLEKYDLQCCDIFIPCHFMDYGLLSCHKNSKLHVWELKLLLTDDQLMSPDVMALSVLDFPISYHKNSLDVTSAADQNEVCKPLIIFIHPDDPEARIFRNIFGVNCLSPNVLCLLGHPEGKLQWSLCNSSNQFQSSHKLQTLFDIKQPIIGIFFIKNIEGLEDCNCIVLVGAFGQITAISSKRYSSFTQESGSHIFWFKTDQINSSVTSCDIVKENLLYTTNDGELWISNLSVIFQLNDKNEQLISSSFFSEYKCIEQMIVADKNLGLILLKTKYGNMFLIRLKKEDSSVPVTSSLPTIMNDCLIKSNKMQEMLKKKVLQSRMFAVISTFAKLKFLKNILKEPMTFSISEVNLEPKKYILVINLKCLENLNLDSELCHVSATAFTYFKNSNSFVTKSAPYNMDKPTLCLEFTDTVFQAPLTSIFPLLVEVGLILHLPESWKAIDCFKRISVFLPFYLPVQTFMVHELNILQSNALCFPESLNLEIPKTLKTIKELGMKRPISSILQIGRKEEFDPPKKFNLCVSLSSVEEMLKSTNDSDSCKYIEKLLFGNSDKSKESYLLSKNSPGSIKISKNSTHIQITLTADNSDILIGLRIAVMEILLAAHRKSKQSSNSSTYINIPANIYRKCEEISKSLLNLYGKDVESDEVTNNIINLYKEFRTDISGKLPIL